MGDFFLDFRSRTLRQARKAGDLLRFHKATQSVNVDEPAFGLAITLTERPDLWAPYRAIDGTFVALAGRVSLDESEWRAGESVPGEGGLACKAIYAVYRRSGLAGVETLGGNRVILVHDAPDQIFHIATDWAGAFPAFRFESTTDLVFASHPDVLALLSGEQGNLDETSLAEFLFTSTVTAPFTYYRRIRSLQHGTTISVRLAAEPPVAVAARRYLELALRPDPALREGDLAEALAHAFQKSVQRRTLPRLGRTAVALSGGLDSRAILACVRDREQVFAFCCYDEPNRELRTAEAIASALRVPFFAWQRDAEYYGRNAEAGVRISGGMGTFANNHFLGMVDRLRSEGAENLLTGCYCDYLFKALPLNRTTHWFTGSEQVAPFSHQFYFGHHIRQSPLAGQVMERLESRVPAEFQSQRSAADLFQVEAHRTFPLCYEGDNQQRVVPQRVAGWYLPMADKDIMDVYRKTPSSMKLNRAVFSRAVSRLCNGSLSSIPDANTGARVGASAFAEAVHHGWSRVRGKVRVPNGSIGTNGSWPDWQAYVSRSTELRKLWKRPNASAADLFSRILDPKDVRAETTDYQGGDIWLMIPMLTLKLWFEQWHS